MYIALYNTSSIQRLVDFVKIVCSFKEITPVVIKPIGAAAQVGVPEAYRITYRFGKPLIILAEISDLHEVLGVSEIYYVDSRGVKKSIRELSPRSNIALVINSGEGEPSKKELEKINIVYFEEIPSDLPPLALISILLYLLFKSF